MADNITQDDEYEYEYIELEEGQELPEGVEYEFVEVEDNQPVAVSPAQNPVVDDLEEVDLSVFSDSSDRNIDDLLDEILDDKPSVETERLERRDERFEAQVIADLETVKPLSSAELLALSKEKETLKDVSSSYGAERVEPNFSAPFEEEEVISEVPLVQAIDEEEEVLNETNFSFDSDLEEKVSDEVILSFDNEEIIDEVPLVEEEEVLEEVPLIQEIKEDISEETVLSLGADISSPLEEAAEEIILEPAQAPIVTIVTEQPAPVTAKEYKTENVKLYDVVEIDGTLKQYAKVFDASKSIDSYQSKENSGVVSISSNQAKLAVFNRRIISLEEDVREINLPLDKDNIRYVRVVKAGEEKLSLFNEEVLKFMVPTEDFVKIKSYFIYGNLEQNTGLIVDDIINLSLDVFKGKMLRFTQPVNGMLIDGAILYFAEIKYLIVE